MDHITDDQRQQLGWIVEAAKRDGLALLEVECVSDGSPAVLLVAVDRDEEGKGGRMSPLARIDVDFVDFDPPEGIEKVELETHNLMKNLESSKGAPPLAEELENLRRLTEIDIADGGC